MRLETLRREFLTPGREYTPIPFWFWNDDLTEEEIGRQMREFHEKGVDGFIIHPRTGLPKRIGYLTEEYFRYVRYAVELAQRLEMKVILYDEAMYPSGSCHGEVVRQNPAFASRGLRMSESPKLEEGEKEVAVLTKNGETRYFIECFSGGTIRGVYEGEDDREPDAPESADLLNPEAVACFIRLTHDRYYEQLKEHFGKTVIGMFTDEPNILGRCARTDVIPWSSGLLEEFLREGGKTEDLYALFSECGEEEKQCAESIYQKTIHQRMSDAYYGQIAAWCRAHGIAMTGHPEKSTDIGYLKHFDIPCQDVVWRFVAPEGEKGLVGEHSTMAKCSSDSARHRGKRRNGNECFGCCSMADNPYQLSKADMKWYLDWLFVRGVNLIIPHAFYYSVRGSRKEERPPEVGMHSGYWEEYRQITDYIKRMSWLMTDCVNQAETAVLCSSQELSWEIAKPLFENQIEFNYLEEELLEEARCTEEGLIIAQQCYRVIVTDGRVRAETLEALGALEKKGMKVIRYRQEMDLAALLQDCSGADLKAEPACRALRKSHVKKEGISFYLLTNESDCQIETSLSVAEGKIREVWDAWTGEVQECQEPSGRIRLILGGRESRILAVSE